jgi:DNA-binding protein H-NS
MARSKNIESMSVAELAAMEARIARAKIERQGTERTALREKLTAMAKDAGFDIRELFDGRGGKRGKVAVKYRDKDGNTWTGRGRMPRWLTAAMKGGKAKKDDFLIS